MGKLGLEPLFEFLDPSDSVGVFPWTPNPSGPIVGFADVYFGGNLLETIPPAPNFLVPEDSEVLLAWRAATNADSASSSFLFASSNCFYKSTTVYSNSFKSSV